MGAVRQSTGQGVQGLSAACRVTSAWTQKVRTDTPLPATVSGHTGLTRFPPVTAARAVPGQASYQSQLQHQPGCPSVCRGLATGPCQPALGTEARCSRHVSIPFREARLGPNCSPATQNQNPVHRPPDLLRQGHTVLYDIHASTVQGPPHRPETVSHLGPRQVDPTDPGSHYA